MTSHKRGATEAEASSSSSAKIARLGSKEQEDKDEERFADLSIFSRAQLDLADALYRRAPTAPFTPVFLRRISTFYPRQWAKFNARTHGALSFDVRKYIDRFFSLSEYWDVTVRMAKIRLHIIGTSLYMKFEKCEGQKLFDGCTEALQLIESEKPASERKTRDEKPLYFRQGRAIQTLSQWIRMMFPPAVTTVNLVSNEILIAGGTEYIEQLRALLLDARVGIVKVCKNAE